MKGYQYPNTDVGSSVAKTLCNSAMREKFKAALLVENCLKNGIPLMYWTCLCIGMDGRYAIDLRDIPGAAKDAVELHAQCLQPHLQRDIALQIIDRGFSDVESLSSWCRREAELLADWRGNAPTNNNAST